MQSNSELICKKDGCTLADTGVCIFNNTPEFCPERLQSIGEDEGNVGTNPQIAGPVLEAPPEGGKFSHSFTLSVHTATEMRKSRDCKTIGILGIPNTGKTAFLVSLYLLLAGKRFDNLEFRNSKSLMAFEEISRGTRKWKEGEPPEQMTMHTEIKDERTAGFLHLKLFSKRHNRILQFLFPDLPGEWTNSLVTSNRTDRLSFLRDASVIWLMVNGQDISNPKTRMNAIYRIEVLIDRIFEFLGSDIPKIEIVITHLDKSGSVVQKLEDLLENYKTKDLIITLKETAAFATPESGLLAGHGIEKLISELFDVTPSKPIDFWPPTSLSQNDRSFMKINPKV